MARRIVSRSVQKDANVFRVADKKSTTQAHTDRSLLLNVFISSPKHSFTHTRALKTLNALINRENRLIEREDDVVVRALFAFCLSLCVSSLSITKIDVEM